LYTIVKVKKTAETDFLNSMLKEEEEEPQKVLKKNQTHRRKK